MRLNKCMNKPLAQVFFGSLVVVIGAGFLLDTLGVVNFTAFLRDWWPLLLVGGGVASLLSNPRLWIWPSILVVVGALLLLRSLEVVSFNVWNVVWPFLLIVFGLSLIFKKGFEPDETQEASNVVDLTAIFSGHNVRLAAEDFAGGKLTAVFGGIELDLTDSKITKTATLDVFAAFGGVELRVPEGWVVKVQGLPLFGGWEDKTRKPSNAVGSPILVVRGTCLFGGFEVKN